jgi:hypothetical protein
MKQLLERWIELLKTSGSNTKKQVREEMEKFLEELNAMSNTTYDMMEIMLRVLQELTKCQDQKE